jgi:hypothetical protein
MSRPRLHKSSIVVALIAAFVAVLLEVPGRVIHGTSWNDRTTGKTDVFTIFEHGWPWVYLRRATYWHYADDDVPPERQMNGVADTRSDLPMWSVPWLSAENWSIWQSYYHDDIAYWTLNWSRILWNVTTVLFAVVLLVVAWECRRRRRPHVFSFGLIELFVAFTVAGGVFGWGVYMKREQQRERDLIANIRSVWSLHSEECIAPLWMRSLLGDRLVPSFLWRTTSAEVQRDDYVDHGLPHLKEIAQLSYMTRILVYGNAKEYPPFPFALLNSLIRLEELDLSGSYVADDESGDIRFSDITEQDVEQLIQLDGIRKIFLDTGDISPKLLARLKAGLPNCKIVDAREGWW